MNLRPPSAGAQRARLSNGGEESDDADDSAWLVPGSSVDASPSQQMVRHLAVQEARAEMDCFMEMVEAASSAFLRAKAMRVRANQMPIEYEHEFWHAVRRVKALNKELLAVVTGDVFMMVEAERVTEADSGGCQWLVGSDSEVTSHGRPNPFSAAGEEEVDEDDESSEEEAEEEAMEEDDGDGDGGEGEFDGFGEDEVNELMDRDAAEGAPDAYYQYPPPNSVHPVPPAVDAMAEAAGACLQKMATFRWFERGDKISERKKELVGRCMYSYGDVVAYSAPRAPKSAPLVRGYVVKEAAHYLTVVDDDGVQVRKGKRAISGKKAAGVRMWEDAVKDGLAVVDRLIAYLPRAAPHVVGQTREWSLAMDDVGQQRDGEGVPVNHGGVDAAAQPTQPGDVGGDRVSQATSGLVALGGVNDTTSVPEAASIVENGPARSEKGTEGDGEDEAGASERG